MEEELEELETGEDDGLVPYAPDFTPATLGKKLGADRVLPWLLEQTQKAGLKGTLLDRIAATCLAHIDKERDRRDMASHVVQGLQNYLLISVDDESRVVLTGAGEQVLAASAAERDRVFARHILTRCNGYRLVEVIERQELRGEKATLEKLTEDLDRSATSKNISSMRAWLARAGVMKGRGYAIDDARVAEILGASVKRLLGLDRQQVEFLLAARVLAAQQPGDHLEASDIKCLAETRAPDVRLPGKALGKFVKQLVDQGLLVDAGKVKAKGGSRVAVKLSDRGFDLSDEQIRAFVAQSGTGMQLSDLQRLDEILENLEGGTPEERGRLGEMLAVHACLMLDIRVVGWRVRSPAEVDLTAERTVGLTYQRWHVQVKNTAESLGSDRVDREIGAAAGTGATHLLFVVPRANVTQEARNEIQAKNTLTHLHIYTLTVAAMSPPLLTANLLRDLRSQEARLIRQKRVEAERRERLL